MAKGKDHLSPLKIILRQCLVANRIVQVSYWGLNGWMLLFFLLALTMEVDNVIVSIVFAYLILGKEVCTKCFIRALSLFMVYFW